MRAYARIRTPAGDEVDVCPGDVIGRLRSAAIRLDNPRISEAHALVSLRGAELKLLALRGVLAVDGKPTPELVLRPGLRVHLAPDAFLEVTAVELPDQVLALSGGGVRATPLTGSVYTLVLEPRPLLLPRFDADGVAHFWSIGDGWRASIPPDEPRELQAGETLRVGERELQVTAVPVAAAGQAATQDQGRLHPPVRIVSQFDTVHLHRDGAEPLVLSGLPARIVSELVCFDGPVAWDVLARQLWRREDDRLSLRRNLDVNLVRLRKKLRGARLRPDLVRADGTGKIELVLYEGDRIEDRS